MSRKIGIAAVVVAALLLALGSFSRSWWTNDTGMARIGLRSGHLCLAGQCQKVRLGALVTQDPGWIRANNAAYGAGLIAAGLLLAAAVLRIRYSRGARVIPAMAAVGAATALVAAVLALRSFPHVEGMRASWGALLYAGGALLGLAGSITLVGRGIDLALSR